jgi:hypothetical protein
MVVESPAAPDLMITELERRTRARQQRAKALALFLERPRADGLAVEMEEVKREKDERIAVPCVRCILDQAERARAIGTDTAQLAIEISLPCRERCNRYGDGRVFVGPVKPDAGQQPDRAPVQPGMHPVPVEFRPFWRLVDQFGELRFDPIRQRGRLRPLPSQQRHVTSKPPALAQTRETE